MMDAPLQVFSGVDMPAIMIEAGYLSNPIEEKKLKSIQYLSELANAICLGIQDYFNHAESQISP